MVLVGGGECTARCAFELRRLGYDGPVTVVGAEPHLPYERPLLSKALMTSPDDTLPSVAGRSAYDDARIELLLGRPVVSIDRGQRTVGLAGGQLIAFERLLLATGAVARPLFIDGVRERRACMLRSLDDARRISDAIGPGVRLLIVGAGLVGLELASSASQRGAVVTVVESASRAMSRGIPGAIAAAVVARHRAEGVAILCDTRVRSIRSESSSMTVHLETGDVVGVDLLVAAVGIEPGTRLAEDSGLAVDNGIAVSSELETSDPTIFAAGDCCSFPLPVYGGRRVRLESWRSAVEQGELAARNMLGAHEPVSSTPWLWSDHFELTLQVAGLCDEAHRDVRRDLADDAFVLFHVDASGRLVAASGIGPSLAVAKHIAVSERLIGQGARPSARALESPEISPKQLLIGHGAEGGDAPRQHP